MATIPSERTRYTGKGTWPQRIRLWSGLFLFAYVLAHYANHALGHISLAAMEQGLEVVELAFGNPVGSTLLYGSLIAHTALAMWRVATISTWRRPTWEWTQIALGVAIPWFLLSHLTYTAFSEAQYGIDVDYAEELALLWPAVWVQQSLLLLVVWVHACLGIHFWLRIRPWYGRYAPLLAGLAVLWPALALTGWIAAARREFEARTAAALAVPGSGQSAGDNGAFIASILPQLRVVEDVLQTAALVAAGIVVVILATRWTVRRFRSRVKVVYGDGRTVLATPGMTLLDVSRSAGIPHMAVCGGRARCSTCRTLVLDGLHHLSPVGEAEASLLEKLNAGAGIRLACQARVRGDVEIRPLIQPQSSIAAPRNADPLGWGVEREVAILFLDIRGFSRISEKSLPYDVVFILNSLFGEVGGAIESANGYIDKFMGDGLMAIFGLASTPAEASRDALRAALAAEQATQNASRVLTQHLNEPLRIGIGVHTGHAVIGRIGKTADQTSPSRLTAIGGTVNIAARLETATKDLAAGLVVSAYTLATAGIERDVDIGEHTTITVHNISEPVDVVAVRDSLALREELGLPLVEMAAQAGREAFRQRTKKTGNA